MPWTIKATTLSSETLRVLFALLFYPQGQTHTPPSQSHAHPNPPNLGPGDGRGKGQLHCRWSHDRQSADLRGGTLSRWLRDNHSGPSKWKREAVEVGGQSQRKRRDDGSNAWVIRGENSARYCWLRGWRKRPRAKECRWHLEARNTKKADLHHAPSGRLVCCMGASTCNWGPASRVVPVQGSYRKGS